MNFIQRIQRLWRTEPGIVIPEGSNKQVEPFVVFPCHQCNTPVALIDRLEPGQVAVIDCPNCATSMTVYLPFLQIYRTKELPPHLQKPVWEKLAL